MNRVLNKDDCPELFQHSVIRHFSDVLNPASCMQVFPVTRPGSSYSVSVVPHYTARTLPALDSGGLMHDK
jgi:hypothetical protein